MRSQPRRSATSPAASTALATTEPPPSDPPGAALVLAALRALRRDHDPERARVLLEDYLGAYPEVGGALAEEARALAIEAALALRAPDASSLAEDYLRRYPSGRYRAQALRARQAVTP